MEINMGLIDAFSAEDRVSVKYSDFYSFMKASARAEVIWNGVKTRVPYEFIEAMVTGKIPEVQEVQEAQNEDLPEE